MKVAVITCYKDPDYIRARTLRAGLQQLTGVEALVIKNRRKGLGRYAEVLAQVWAAKFRDRPDAYLVTFRGYEILPFVLLIAGRQPVIFDELINLTEWVVDEHQKVPADGWAAKLLNWWYGRQLRRCRFILADTPAHAEYSARRSNVAIEKYRTIPVGADETIFQPNKNRTEAEEFQVLYYGSMLPLHGLDVMLAAAEQLKDQPINFLLIGGGPAAEAQVAQAKSRGARVEYRRWVNFNQLPSLVNQSQLCLAGPFGNTVQSQLVVTGKAYQFLACAAPTIIGANIASTNFHDKINALVVPQGDATALAAAISWAYKNRTKLTALGQAGRLLYDQKFSTSVIANQLRLLLDQLATGAPHG